MPSFASPRRRVAALLFLLAGCASGEVAPGDDSGGSDGRDSGAARDSGSGSMADAGPARDTGAARDSGPARDGGGGGGRDSGMTSCPSGEHACGAGCVRDLANDPANGCRLGCGEPCDAPDMGDAACDMAGMCTWMCEPPFRRMGDTCVCTATTCEAIGYECGAPDDGCGMPLDCGSCGGGGTCTMGRCGCSPDMNEPNDSNTMATARAGLNDADDPPDVILSGNIDEMRDEDWWTFPITDGTDGGNPRITVTLRNIPIGSDYALSAYYVCGGSEDNSTCSMGAPDNYVGNGCAGHVTGSGPESVEIETDCSRGLSADDSATLLVRVTAPTWMSTCGPYEVVVRVR